jgi:hypothetical protein
LNIGILADYLKKWRLTGDEPPDTMEGKELNNQIINYQNFTNNSNKMQRIIEMAKSIGSGWWPGTGQPQSEESQEFWMRHGENLTALNTAISEAFKAKDGNTLVLMDTALRALVINIAEGLRQSGVKFETDK